MCSLVAQANLTLDRDHLVVALSAQNRHITLHMKSEVAVRDARQLRDLLEAGVDQIELSERTDATQDDVSSPSHVAPAEGWMRDIVRCGCGRSFPKHGLGALGKHAVQCAKASDIQVRTPNGILYRRVLEAIELWSKEGPFTVPEIVGRFENAQAPISYSGVRTHVDYLVSIGHLRSLKEGRNRRFYPKQEVTA